MKSLAARFKLRLFRFAESTDRLESAADLAFEGGETHLPARAGAGAAGAVGGPPVRPRAGDGRSRQRPLGRDRATSSSALKARSIPVFTVGLGRERFEKDVELSAWTCPRPS